jgi:hypothetical protein
MRRLATTGTALVLGLALATSAGAQALDPQATEALAATLKMLIDPSQRSAAIAGSPQATAIDQQIRSITGSEALTQELFALAADVFQEMTVATNGDADKMLQALDAARSNPSGFAATLSPATLERLRALSVKISDQKR